VDRCGWSQGIDVADDHFLFDNDHYNFIITQLHNNVIFTTNKHPLMSPPVFLVNMIKEGKRLFISQFESYWSCM